MRRLFLMLLSLAIVVATPLLLIYLGFQLARPPGFPWFSSVISNFDDGTSWWYCKEVPSGHVWIGSTNELKIKFGSTCGAKTGYYYNPISSTELPGIIIYRSGSVALSVPDSSPIVARQKCDIKFDRFYFERAIKIMHEVKHLDEKPIKWNMRFIDTATLNLSRAKEIGLETAGSDGGTHLCVPRGTLFR